MSDPLGRVSPGDPLRIGADTFNLLLDAAKFVRGQKPGRGGAGSPLDDSPTPALEVYVRNDAGSSLPEFSVVALGTPVISASDAPLVVARQPVFPGTAPAAATDAFAVLTEPLASGKIGRAVVMGVVPCDLSVSDSSHTCAKPAVGVTATLASAADGPARIIWKASGTGTKRAVVLVGRDTAGATAAVYEKVDLSTGSISSGDSAVVGGSGLTIPSTGFYMLFGSFAMTAKASALNSPGGSWVRCSTTIAGSGTFAGGYAPVTVVNYTHYATVSGVQFLNCSSGQAVNATLSRSSSSFTTWTDSSLFEGHYGYLKIA